MHIMPRSVARFPVTQKGPVRPLFGALCGLRLCSAAAFGQQQRPAPRSIACAWFAAPFFGMRFVSIREDGKNIGIPAGGARVVIIRFGTKFDDVRVFIVVHGVFCWFGSVHYIDLEQPARRLFT